MNNRKTRLVFWIGISFLIAGIVSFAITLEGEGPSSFIEELTGSSIGWIIIGISLIVFSLIKNKS